MMESQAVWADLSQFSDLKLGIQAISSVHENRRELSPILGEWISHLEELDSASE